MSCHYSCLTCSASVYADLCLTCPSTRQLIDTTCICSSSLYEYQMKDCISYEQISSTDYSFSIMMNILYYIMLGFSWLFILGNLNRLYSSKIRCMVTFCQLTSLLLDYRYRFTSLTENALKVLSVWNFRYFDTLFCSQQKSKPYQCQSYQNLYGPLLTLATFILALFISFIMTKTCIFSLVSEKQQNSQQQQQQKAGDIVIINRGRQKYQHYNQNSTSSIKSMTLLQYLRISFRSFLLMYIDYSVVQWTVQLSRISYTSVYLSYGMYILLIILTIIFALYFLSVINSPGQFNVEYRSRMGYLYMYDKKYYLNYLDYLYAEQRSQRHFQSYKHKGQYTPERYYPQSNYIVLQIVTKFLISAMTIIMFEYKPQLWVIPTLIVMMSVFAKLGVFLVYERLALLIYYLGVIVYFICVLVFWLDYFFNVWAVIVAIVTTFAYFILLVSDLSDWTREKEGRFWQVAFQYIDQDIGGKQVDGKVFQLRSQQHEQLQVGQPQKQNHQQSFNDLIKQKNSQNFSKNKMMSSHKLSMNANKALNQTNKSIGSLKQSQKSVIPEKVTKTIFGNSKISYKKNLNQSQKMQMSNISNNNDPFIDQNRSNLSSQNGSQTLSPQINPNQSFMSRTNRVRFDQGNGLKSNGSFNKSNSRLNQNHSLQRSNGIQLISNLPEIQQDKQQSVDMEDGLSQFKGNEGQRLSQTSLIKPQNNNERQLNDSFGSRNDKTPNSKIFNTTNNRRQQNSNNNIFQGSRQSKR